ncbi:RHS repeat-associated core domain-containing protein [Pseudomonas parafulva]|uniref:RHS repeat-associated core domain-containing protein n=1 Tax=Pseudomonas parafulva TaxID=157782 RepID=A0AAI8KA55_9PSED|nr:RHS repeat-associated core domain-containing protein [Pseudomonas parafulva]AXO89059.1 RHS repeat-associated core domain-containing protein [Pseudomonas parafulva]
MSDRETARLHADTPQLSVRSSTGAQAASLRLLRQSHADTPRTLRHRTHTDEISRTVREFGPRPLRTSEGAPTLADAAVYFGLGGRPLALHSVDGDTSLALVDGAGRPLWTCNAQGTRHWHDYERPEQGARRHALFEQAAAGLPRMRERLIYAPVTDAQRARNRAGAVMEHFDDAGLTRTVALALTGQPLEQRQCLLQVQLDQPDWTEGPEDDLETDVHTALCDYDATGELLNRTDAVGLTRSIERDISGAVCRTCLRQGDREALALADATRRADGKVVRHESGNGVVDHYRYSPLDHRLIQHRTARPADHPLGYLLISDLHYRYDPVGNLLELDDQGADPQWHGNQRTDGLREYAYDTLYRLIDASGRERTPVAGYRSPAFGAADHQGGSVWTPYREHYVYDDGDNLTTLDHNGGSGQRSRQLRVSTHSNRALPEGHGLTPDTGFFAGGLQRQMADGRALTWRADNQLAEVTLVTRAREAMDDREQYRYADGGTRRRKINTVQVAGAAQITVTTYLDGCELRIRTRDGQPATQRHVLISETDGVRWIQDRVHGKTYLRYAFTDHLGSSMGETDEAGNIVSREEFTPYGESAGVDEPAAEVDGLRRRTQRHAGKELDASGLYYYGWRYYQPGSCRWLSADPGGLVDGVNLFRMARSNPLRYSDVTGMAPFDDFGSAMDYVFDLANLIILFGLLGADLWELSSLNRRERLLGGGPGADEPPERPIRQYFNGWVGKLRFVLLVMRPIIIALSLFIFVTSSSNGSPPANVWLTRLNTFLGTSRGGIALAESIGSTQESNASAAALGPLGSIHSTSTEWNLQLEQDSNGGIPLQEVSMSGSGSLRQSMESQPGHLHGSASPSSSRVARTDEQPFYHTPGGSEQSTLNGRTSSDVTNFTRRYSGSDFVEIDLSDPPSPDGEANVTPQNSWLHRQLAHNRSINRPFQKYGSGNARRS